MVIYNPMKSKYEMKWHLERKLVVCYCVQNISRIFIHTSKFEKSLLQLYNSMINSFWEIVNQITLFAIFNVPSYF